MCLVSVDRAAMLRMAGRVLVTVLCCAGISACAQDLAYDRTPDRKNGPGGKAVIATGGTFQVGCPQSWEVRHDWGPAYVIAFRPGSESSFPPITASAQEDSLSPQFEQPMDRLLQSAEDANLQVLDMRPLRVGGKRGALIDYRKPNGKGQGRTVMIHGARGLLTLNVQTSQGFSQAYKEVLGEFEPLSPDLLLNPAYGSRDWEPCPATNPR